MFYLFFLVPIPAGLLAALYIAWDLYGLRSGHASIGTLRPGLVLRSRLIDATPSARPPGHAAHLMGALVGALFWAVD